MFYTFVARKGNKIHYIGYRNGKKIHHEHPFEPYLCFKSNVGDTKSIYNETLKTKTFDTISDFNKFKYANKDNFELYADIDPAYQFLYKKHENKIDYDLSVVRTWFLDIETPYDDGFPSPETTPAEIKSIAIYDSVRQEYLVLGLDDYIEKKDVKYKKYRNEKELLRSFIKLNHNLAPDVWIAHNGDGFDYPYIINRIQKILGDKELKELSPMNKVSCKSSEKPDKWGNIKLVFSSKIEGISLIDNIALYKKYIFSPRSSYSLANLAIEDLKDDKINYEEYDNLHTLYKENHQLFIDYNIHDVEIMVNLNKKYHYLEAHQINTYRTKTKNFNESMSPVRLWDSYLNTSMMKQGLQTAQHHDISKFSYPGAYVMEPKTILRKHVLSFDLDSLYPHLQMEWNISVETLVTDLTVDKWLNSLSIQEIEEMIEKETIQKKKDFLISLKEDKEMGFEIEPINQKELDERMLNGLIPQHPKYIMTANGFYFRKEKLGIMPSLLKSDYAERKVVKAKMKKLKKLQQKEFTQERADEILSLHALQMAIKILMNSGYGAFGSIYFRYCKYELCSSITMNGQLAIKWLNRYFYESFGDKVEVCYNDTDSTYITIEKIVKKNGWDKLSESDRTDKIDEFAENVIQPIIQKAFNDLAEYVGAPENYMHMKREKIISDIFWTGKKRYAYRCLDNEGVRYKVPEFGYTGLECIKSTTPKNVQKSMKDVIESILTDGDYENVLHNSKDKLRDLPIEELAISKTCNGLNKYSKNGTWSKGAQAHVKGAIIYNNYIKNNKLTGSYPKFMDGDKIKLFWLKMPNPFQNSPTFGYVSRIPKDELLRELCDKNLCVEKSFVKPMEDLLEKIDMGINDSENIEDMFN